jgi:hypothetical protein
MVTRLYEWDKNETGWTWIEITDNKVVNLILRNLNNLIKVNGDNEVYVDLQLDSWIESTDTLPIWVNVGRVLQADGRPATWTLISWKTTSWDRVKVLYGDDWVLRVDNWTWTWKILQYEMSAWNWISIVNNTITNTWVTSVNGQTWDITIGWITGLAQISVDSISSWVATVSVVSGTPENWKIIWIFISNSVANTDGIGTIVLNNANITVYPRINPKSNNQIQNIAAYFYHDAEHNMDILIKMGEATYAPLV